MPQSSLLRELCCVATLVLVISNPLSRTESAARAAVSSPPPHDPWSASQLISPKTLLRELQGKEKPIVMCVGFPVLYQAAHIPGAEVKGPAREAAGLSEIKQWARSISKDQLVVIYCGCCPFKECPNIRPAYEVLRQAGLTKIQVLNIPSNFKTDWMDKGYPITPEK